MGTLGDTTRRSLATVIKSNTNAPRPVSRPLVRFTAFDCRSAHRPLFVREAVRRGSAHSGQRMAPSPWRRGPCAATACAGRLLCSVPRTQRLAAADQLGSNRADGGANVGDDW
jgi:hypothetical protein